MIAMNSSKRYYFMDLLRILSFLIIIGYHFFKDLHLRFSAAVPDPDDLLQFCGIHLVMISVSLFFMISGAGLTLQMNRKSGAEGRISVWKDYYAGRFFQIMIPFYVSWLLYAVWKLKETHGAVFAGIPLWRLAFTVCGIDEYVNMTGFRTFTLGIGEWFLGALILIYLIFPLLYTCLRRWELPAVLISAAYYILLILNYHSSVPWHLNVFVKIFEFIFGMVIAMHLETLRKHPAFCLLILAPLLPLPAPFLNTLVCAGIFMLALMSEPLLNRSEALGKALRFIGGYTFYIYLIHHAVIYTFNDRLFWHLVDTRLGMILPLFLIELAAMLVLAVCIRRVCDLIRRFLQQIIK